MIKVASHNTEACGGADPGHLLQVFITAADTNGRFELGTLPRILIAEITEYHIHPLYSELNVLLAGRAWLEEADRGGLGLVECIFLPAWSFSPSTSWFP